MKSRCPSSPLPASSSQTIHREIYMPSKPKAKDGTLMAKCALINFDRDDQIKSKFPLFHGGKIHVANACTTTKPLGFEY
jgi:hypothetical protein